MDGLLRMGIKSMVRKMIFLFFPLCANVCVFRDDFLFFFCINVFLLCFMDTLRSGTDEMVDRVFLV